LVLENAVGSWNLKRFISVITKLVLFIFEKKCIAKTVYIIVNAFCWEECYLLKVFGVFTIYVIMKYSMIILLYSVHSDGMLRMECSVKYVMSWYDNIVKRFEKFKSEFIYLQLSLKPNIIFT
jgi:hypothetical protein